MRLAAATWGAIVNVLVPGETPARATLEGATGVAASLIAAEAWRAVPLVVSGAGPQLRIYCVYGEDAILGEETNEDAVSWSPTDGDWRMEVPCPPDDLDWVTAAFADVSAWIDVVDNSVKRASAAGERTVGSVPPIDTEAFLRG